ncbi:hypothetical protein [Salinicoccus roseus]|uniref:hypothetical protein n=2 Tax=Salinicoccus roseus TaxID=45670 RepID=UPI000F4FB40D|nr:hypothetical protein [Salinicoccus roseus]RPE55100.1 hypothetical protein EDC33_1365 [Salinicoccus roseus]GGA60098.1 hypothetical protein GCM10007176_00680 [Salinicoccus roseus]
MNDKVKMAATLLPVILVPLFNERKRIKKHPDVQKIGEASTTVYHAAKDKGSSAAESVKNAGTSTYQTGKSAVSKVGGAVTDKRMKHTYKKDQKQYEQSLKQEESLLKQFEKEKEKHRKDRLKEQTESRISVPKMLQSGPEEKNGDKSQSMTVSDDHREPDAVSPEAQAEKKSNPDNYGIAVEYDTDQSRNRASLSEDDEERLAMDTSEETGAQNNDEHERLDNMNQNINHWIDKKVKGHDEDTYENGELFTEHKNVLDPRNAETRNENTEQDNSLFNQHRALHESQVSSIGRRTGEAGAVKKSRKQKKLEKKINKHRKKQYK